MEIKIRRMRNTGFVDQVGLHNIFHDALRRARMGFIDAQHAADPQHIETLQKVETYRELANHIEKQLQLNTSQLPTRLHHKHRRLNLSHRCK